MSSDVVPTSPRRSRPGIKQEKRDRLDELFEQILREQNAADAKELRLGSPTQLPASLADVEQRRARIREALDKARAADELRRQQGVNPEKIPPKFRPRTLIRR